MQNTVKLPQVKDIKTLPEAVLTHPETIIRTRFLSLNMKTRDAVIQLDYKGPSGKKFVTIVTQARLTVWAMDWLTKEKPINDEHGKFTGEAETNFKKYLTKRDIPTDTSLSSMTFECSNHSEEYALNPFSLRFHKKFDTCTVELVNMPSKRPIIKTNPMTNENVITNFIYPRRSDNGHILKLPKKYYKRVIVKS